MNSENWKSRKNEFEKVDVRYLQGNFFEGLKKKAGKMIR